MNDNVYRPPSPDDPDIQAMAESMREHGVLEAIRITRDGFILSGHRRHCAATVAGLETVPVVEESITRDDPAFARLLVLHNQQRQKTVAELLAEQVVQRSGEDAHFELLQHRAKRSRNASGNACAMVVDRKRIRSEISPAKQQMLDAVLQERLAASPLFGAPLARPLSEIREQARSFHSNDQAQRNALESLRKGIGLTKMDYEQSFADGRRLAPAIEQLRNAHGLTIDGCGTTDKPYRLPDVRQTPTLARVTPDMKAIYYTLPHWLRVKATRESRDSHCCVLCLSMCELRCHHVSYVNLFNELLEDLLTLCDRCHGRVHEDCRLKFPSGVSVKYAHWLGWKGFEAWLLP